MHPWGGLLASIDPAKLPGLKTIKMDVRWPLSEREIAGDFGVPYAEALLEKGIKIHDIWERSHDDNEDEETEEEDDEEESEEE
ncbi:hypothetical protein HDZ31DRAFT_70985 [Schizophyllum fasciatum]